MDVSNTSNIAVPTVTETAQTLEIQAGALTISVDKASARLAFGAAHGAISLREELPVAVRRTSEQVWTPLGAVEHWHVDAGSVVIVVSVADEPRSKVELQISFSLARVCQVRIQPQSAAAYDGLRMQFASPSDEHFFGTGERFTTVDQRGKRFTVWADDQGTNQADGHPWTYWPVPFVISTQGYGVWLDSTSRSDFDLCATNPASYTINADTSTLVYEVFFGPHPLTVLDLFTQRTERPLMAPRWNNGVWRTSLGGTEAVLAEARRIRELHIPCSALWLYDAHDPRGNIGWPINCVHHSGDYPDMRQLVTQLHDLGFKVQTYMYPYYYVDTARFAEGTLNGYFLKNRDGSTYMWPFFSCEGRTSILRDAAMVDFTNPAAVVWWQEQLRYVLVELGFDGWMHDFSEQVPEDSIAFDGRNGRELHNEYPVLYQRAAREACQRYKPDASFYARAGYTGSQAWLSAAWTGDQICAWGPYIGLESALVACLSLSLTGVPYHGPDIGGFFGLDLPEEPDSHSKELWLRWMQFGALCPIMRDHLGSKPDDSIELFTDDETIASFTTYARLHTSLSPYLLGCSREAAATGAPLMRHLFLEAPADPATWSCDTQYLLGDALLVAPVLHDGARSRTVYFPAGQWISYWDGALYNGGAEAEVPAPLDQIPLFVRYGAVLPTLLHEVDTLAEATDPAVRVADDDLRVTAYLPAQWTTISAPGSSQRTLADDTHVSSTWSSDTVTFAFRGSVQRTYQWSVPCAAQPPQIALVGQAGEELPIEAVQYDQQSQMLHVTCTATSGLLTLEFSAMK